MYVPFLIGPRRGARVLAAVAALTLGAACGSDDDGDTDGSDGGDDTGDDGAAEGPFYALANEVYGADSSTTYVNVLSSLDIDEIDYDRALEYAGGRATIAAAGGWLFVAGPEGPVVQRFSIGEDGALVEDGEVSFANYGLEAVIIDEWTNTFVSPTKAYLLDLDAGTTIVWNPTTMEISGEIAPSQSLVREGLSLNGSPAAVRGDRLYRTFYWSDWDAWRSSEEQYLAVYDTTTDEMIALVDERRCPALSNRIERAEDDTLYLSNWIWNVSETLVAGAPSSCAIRIPPGSDEADPDWTLAYPDLTEGREAGVFTYLGGGQGLLNVFHDERIEFGPESDPAELASTTSWRLWQVDLDAGTGAPVEGLDWMTGGTSTFRLDGRAFVFIPGADYAVTHAFEIEGEAASPAFDAEGWSYQMVKVK